MSTDRIDLNGPWWIRADPADAGVSERWWEQEAGQDAPAWREISVPSAWQTVLGIDDPGVAWYRRSVAVPRDWLGAGHRAWLRFESVATDARVWVNGVEVGRHVGDWEPFQFEVTGVLCGVAASEEKGTLAPALSRWGREREQDIEIVVRVDKIPAGPIGGGGGPVWIDGAPVQSGHITKGFHDVVSLQHGGIWGEVALVRTGGFCAVPDGVGIIADADSGVVEIDVELEARSSASPGASSEWVEIEIKGPDGSVVARAVAEIAPGSRQVRAETRLGAPELWWPERPALYEARVNLMTGTPGRGHAAISDSHTVRFGFRTVRTGGPGNGRILLNGRPIFLRGMLDWGHEPEHIAPRPTRNEVYNRFARMRERGFNAVCVCMWYPPRWFYDIADESGMLVWQEHPVWKCPMGDEHVEEYQRHFAAFFRRDRNHPSVVLVSGSCEHERFNPRLADWWWAEAHRLMPDRLLQVQTAFFAWSDPTKTDLYDEHTYDSSGRWVRYLEDVQAALAEHGAPGGRGGGGAAGGPKPFIMGESILYTNWPDVAEFDRAAKQQGSRAASGKGTPGPAPQPWWYPKGLDQIAAMERRIRERYGDAGVERFKRHAVRHHLRGRQFQFERFRSYPNHAGLVMNHLRDVMICRCGFMDEFGRWRFTPEQMLPWMADAPILLQTPDHRQGFVGGQALACRVGVSNFGPSPFEGQITLHVRSDAATSDALSGIVRCGCGEVDSAEVSLSLPWVMRPRRVTVRASAPGLENNSWDLWAVPARTQWPRGVVRLEGLPFDHADREPDFEEAKYSSGWGLPVRNWVNLLPDPAQVAPDLPAWRHDAALPPETRVIVTHKLTPRVVEFLQRGGRVVLLASRAKGSVPTKYISMWGQLPLVPESPVLPDTDCDAVADLLDYDLTRRYCRAIPTMDLNIADTVEPIVRYIYTHDLTDRLKLYDAVFMARVGEGLLIVTSLDHSEDAGQWLLERLVAYAAGDVATTWGMLDAQIVRGWMVNAS